eukprot:853029-Pleurochrysis_carterae.AAC.1
MSSLNINSEFWLMTIVQHEYAHQFWRPLWIERQCRRSARNQAPLFSAPRTMASPAPAQQFLTPAHHPRGR